MHDPAFGDLKVPAVDLLVADRRHDSRRFARFEDDDDLIPLGTLQVGLDNVAPALWRLDDRSVPFFGLLFDPALELLGGVAQHLAADRIDLPQLPKKPTTRSGC